MNERIWGRGCPSDGELRLLMDAPGDHPGLTHVSGCARCGERFADLRAVADSTRTQLERLNSNTQINVDESFRRLRPQLAQGGIGSVNTGGFWMANLFSHRAVRATSALATALAVLLVLALSPMRTVADDFFGQFRVQKFAAVTIPMDLVEPLNSGLLQSMSDADQQQMKDELAGLGTFETTFNMTDLPQAGTVDEAQASFGDFQTPDDLPDGYDAAPNAYVTEAGSASYALNVAKFRQIIDGMNLPIYAFDDVQSDTLDFSVNVPQAVVLEYKNAAGERVLVGEMESPQLSIPDELDMNQLREEILRFPGLPTDLVAQLRAIDDWENTLIIPIPEGAESDDVTVNGQPGLLITDDDMGALVLWEDNGILHAVAGQVSGDEILDIADSMD